MEQNPDSPAAETAPAASSQAFFDPAPTPEMDAPPAAGCLPPEHEFDPVPLRHRHDGWTPERQYGYVVALAEFGHGARAAEAVGMTGQSAARLRRRPEAAAFNRLCDAAWLLARKRHARDRLAQVRAAERGKFPRPGKPNLLNPMNLSRPPNKAAYAPNPSSNAPPVPATPNFENI
jgi:hypothetical protein